MLISPAYAQAADSGGSMLMQLAPLVLIFVVFYFLLIRPQQKKMKEQRAMLEAVKRGDTVVTSGGLIGKVVHVDGNEIGYYASIDREAGGVINKGGYPIGVGSITGMVLNLEGKSILNSERSRLKADGVQEGPKGIPLLATSDHHVSNELPLAEEEKREEGSS